MIHPACAAELANYILRMRNLKNFVTAQIEAAAECIPTKQRAKCKVPCESIAAIKNQYNIKKASLLNKRDLTNISCVES